MKDVSETHQSSRLPAIVGWILIALIAAWLIVAALIVEIDYYDGFDAIANARYFLGESPSYIANRCPVVSIILIPAELIASHPLELRPQHLTSATIHIAFLVSTWMLLIRHFGRSWPVTIAWTATIPTFIFFSYSPFISHDIFPGALFLWMLVLADKFTERQRWDTWICMVVLGAMAALTKHYFGVFWLAVLISRLIARTPIKTLLLLFAGAAISGVITWIGLGLSIAWGESIEQILTRPWQQLEKIVSMYDANVILPRWLYVRNCWAYGILACLLIVPGLIMSLRATALQRSIASAWIFAMLLMHMIQLVEVRYIAYLAPLSAFLIVPVLQSIARKPLLWILVVAILCVDGFISVCEATRITTPFYTRSQLRHFLEPIESDGDSNAPLLMNNTMLSFYDRDPSPLAADRFHRLFHFANLHVQFVYGRRQVIQIDPADDPTLATKYTDGTPALFNNGTLSNPPTWRHQKRWPAKFNDFNQAAALVETRTIHKTSEGDFQFDSGQQVEIRRIEQGGQTGVVFGGLTGGGIIDQMIFPVAIIGDKTWPLRQAAPGYLHIVGMKELPSFDAPFRVKAFMVKADSSLYRK